MPYSLFSATVPVKVVIADDHEIYRDGLKLLLGKFPHVKVIGEAENGKTLIEQCQVTPPDIVLMDIIMEEMNGIEATRYLHEHFPSIGIIALSMHAHINLILEMEEAGAMGYLIKNAGKDEVIAAINAVSNNNPYYCKYATIEINKQTGVSLQESHKPVFTSIEKKIIELICLEKTSEEIAVTLFRSPRTIEEHRQKIKGKMNAKTVVGIVLYAIRHRLSPFPQGIASV